jgi:DedD protein
LREASRPPETHLDRDSEAIPKIIMLLFVGAFTIGGLIGYVTRGFGFFSQTSTLRSTPTRSQTAAPSRREQEIRSVIAPEPMAVPSPVTPPAPKKVSRPAPPAPAPVSRPVPAPVPKQPTVAPSGATKPAGDVSSAGFRVQVGAFRSRENAEALLRRLQEDGFQPYINYVAGMYRVRIGPFSNRADADMLAEELRAKNYDVFVTR